MGAWERMGADVRVSGHGGLFVTSLYFSHVVYGSLGPPINYLSINQSINI